WAATEISQACLSAAPKRSDRMARGRGYCRVPSMEPNMSETSQSRPTHSLQPGTAREQLEQLYRAIGIPAVAAAVAQVARAERGPERPRHDLPAILRDDNRDAA